MHDKKPPTFAFVGWNSFQMLRFRELARALPGSVLVIEKRPGQRCEIADELLTSLDPPVLVWESKRMRELDGVFDVVVCQTLFGQIEQFERSKIAMLQYGLAKEPHNHGPWRALADLCLVYGPYTAEKISHLCPVAQVGNPHFDAWQTPAFHEAAKRRLAKSLDPSKRTILYVPTWGPLSTQDEFMAHVEELADEYNVLIKLHHNTALLEHERTSLTTSRRVQYFGSDDDLLELLVVTDLAISDYSGAIFDALYCRKPVVLLQTRSAERFGTKLDQDSIEYSQRHRVGPVVESANFLRSTIRDVLSGAVSFQAKNGELVEELFVSGASSTERCIVSLKALANTQVATRSPQQEQIRAEERKRSRRAVIGIERSFIERLFRAQLPQVVLPYVELRNRIRPNLFLYRAGVRAAEQQGLHERALMLSKSARRHFPASRLTVTPGNPQSPTHSRKPAKRRSFRPTVGYGVNLPYIHSKKNLSATSLLIRFPRLVKMAAMAMRRERDDSGSYTLIARAQRHHPGHPLLLSALTKLLLDDGKALQAYTYLLLQKAHQGIREQTQRLYLESELGWHERGLETLSELLNQPPDRIAQHLPNINRAAPYYPELRVKLADTRHRVRHGQRLRLALPLHQALAASIDNRWVEDTKSLLAPPIASAPLLRSYGSAHAKKVIHNLGDIAELVEIAWKNEHSEDLLWVNRQTSGKVGRQTSDERIVEFFVPPAFFARSQDEKATYETIRKAFLAIARHLLAAPDIVVVPRLQLNWRHAAPRTSGLTISYHTKSDRAEKTRHLHIQETPFAGFVSADALGYAGFSSLASDFSSIETTTREFSLETLEATRRALYERFAASNASKYPQKPGTFACDQPYVFVALQVASDSVTDLAWMSSIELIYAVAEAYRGSGIRVVAKRHPYCKSPALHRAAQELEDTGHVSFSDASIHSLIASSTAVYTCNSGVGLEALVHMKPVVVTGKCDYLYAATAVRTTQELSITAREPVPFERIRALRLLHHYVNHYAVDVGNPESIQRLVHSIV